MPPLDMSRLPQPIQDFCNELIGEDGATREPIAGGVLYRAPRSAVLYDPVDEAQIETYARLHDFAVPAWHRDFLRRLNGASLYELAIFGLPPSMMQDPPGLSRDGFQPFDLATANQYWRVNYDAPPEALHFAACEIDGANHGDFLFEDGRIARCAEGKTPAWDWPDMDAYLGEELERMKTTGQTYADLLEDLKDYLG